jgi:biofilm PGA synthesis N-glycosyltransferase PgaC
MSEALIAISSNPIFLLAIWFLAAFPIIIATLAVNGSRQLFLDRYREVTDGEVPHLEDLYEAKQRWPKISILIPARDEESNIELTIESALKLNWPAKELIIINDGSVDGTASKIESFLSESNVKVITHEYPLGKSISLNEGFEAARNEIVLILDADARPAQNALDRMVPHFLRKSDIAAVTGNPRVINISNLLTKLQAIEFSSTVSVLRRGQSAWGRVNTISGIMSVFRRSVVLSAGGFSPMQPTEDIEITWRLHRAGYRCIYEPAAQVGMLVPETIAQWWRQRSRWSAGLVTVLKTHGFSLVKEWKWPVFPILTEAIAAIIWCHILVMATLLWIFSVVNGLTEIGNSLVVGRWGTMTIGIAIFQILWGMHLDSNHDKKITKLWILAPVYPIIYWWLSALVVVATAIPKLLRRSKVSTWSLERPRLV